MVNKYFQNILFFLKLNYYRFKNIRIELKIILCISIIGVISSELVFNETISYNDTQYILGTVFLKLSYSYFSAFLFYYLVVFLPKERKRVKAFRYINNKIHFINDLTNGILLRIINETEPEIKKIEGSIDAFQILEYCRKVNPKKEIRHCGILLYKSYQEFITLKLKLIKSSVDEIIITSDLVDDELFLSFANISDIINDKLTFNLDFLFKENLEYLGPGLEELYFENNQICTKFENNYYKRYSFQYERFERKRYENRK